ncbi:hypothetical protein DL770_001078 [Monosporascus sp. CRB-9-2]|nr:hypothetical protein DL770_001078 [Monosporascus sp. CRB-9-2]
MKLPDAMRTRYIQYKRDTDSVANWLGHMAKKCGFPMGEVLKERLDGSSANHTGTREYDLTVRGFSILAGFLSQLDRPPIIVPPQLMLHVKRAIDLRTRYTNDLKDRGMEADDAHHFIVRHLRLASELLAPCVQETTTHDAPDNSKTAPKSENTFNVLDLPESAVDEISELTDLTIPTAKTKSYHAETKSDMEEAYLVLLDLLPTFMSIEEYLLDTWSKNIGSNRDVDISAVVTNTCLMLLRSVEGDIHHVFKPHGGTLAVVNGFLEKSQQQQKAADPKLLRTLTGIHRVCETAAKSFKHSGPTEIAESMRELKISDDDEGYNEATPDLIRFIQLSQFAPALLIRDEITNATIKVLDGDDIALWLVSGSISL